MENNYGEIKVVLSNKLVCSTGISAGQYEFPFAVQIPADLINREILYQQILMLSYEMLLVSNAKQSM